jgi:Tfp pilus assembly protein PilZ
MSGNNKENRKYNRYIVDDLHGKILYSSDLKFINISMDGAAIETTQRLIIGREYSLNLKFGENTLTIKGRVAWSRLSYSKIQRSGDISPVYKTGIQFHNILNKSSLNLIKFIETHKVEGMEKRVLGVRFKIDQPDDAIIDMPVDYQIRCLSLSGMLIETDHPFDIDSQHDMYIDLEGLEKQRLSVNGRVVNCTDLKTDDIVKYNVGIEFININEEDMASLKNLLEQRDS